MLWSYYLPSEWDDHSVKSSWKNFYVFCMEEERDVNSQSYDIDITSYPDEGIRLYGQDLEIEVGLKERGYFVNVDTTEIFLPGNFDYQEALAALRRAIKEIFKDDSVDLIEGDEFDFAGTNKDSIVNMWAKTEIDKFQKAADKETGGDLSKYFESHPEQFKREK